MTAGVDMLSQTNSKVGINFEEGAKWVLVINP